MKPTHIGKLAGQDEPVKLYQSQNFWSDGKHKWRKETGEPAGKNRGPKLILESIEPLPTRIILESPTGVKYLVVESNTKTGTMVLKNLDTDHVFDSLISHAKGYVIHKEFD